MSINNEAAAQKCASNLAKSPIEEQSAEGVISKKDMNGCSWEFVRHNREVEKHLEAFKKNPHVSVQEVTYSHDKGISGYLVSMDFQYMLELLQKEAPGLFSTADLQFIAQHRQKALTDLAKLMASKHRGRIGVYCTNDSSSVTKDGKQYPAFAVTFIELLQVCQKCGYGIVVDNIPREPGEVFKRSTAMLKAATVAPSSNAIFFDIAPL